MRSRFSFFVVVCLFSSFSSISYAQVGSKEEAIKAAMDEKEPAYIKDLMDELSNKLLVVASRKHINTPKERLAWLLTMRAIISITLAAARDAADHADRSIAWKSAAWHAAAVAAAMAAQSVACKIAALTDRDAAWRAARDATSKGAMEAARGALECGASPPKTGIIAYRVAEWAALNYMLDNADRIVGATYQAALNDLPNSPEDNPFNNQYTWLLFYKKHFVNLSDDAMCFLSPWLNISDSSIFIEHQAPNALLSLSTYVNMNFNHFPQELVTWMMRLATQAQVHK